MAVLLQCIRVLVYGELEFPKERHLSEALKWGHRDRG